MQRPENLFRPSVPGNPPTPKMFSPKARYYECGCCGAFHAQEFAGDCRENRARLDLDEIETRHGPNGWTETEM